MPRGEHPNSRANLTPGSKKRKPRAPSLAKFEYDLVKRVRETGWTGSVGQPAWSAYVRTVHDLEHRVKSPLDRNRLVTTLISLENRLGINVRQDAAATDIEPVHSEERAKRVAVILAHAGALGSLSQEEEWGAQCIEEELEATDQELDE